MKKGGASESTIIIGPSKSVLCNAIHSLECVLGLARFRVFVPKLLLYYMIYLFIYNFNYNILRQGCNYILSFYIIVSDIL